MSSNVTESPEVSVKPLRSITPRRGLPSGRALLGALLVTVAALGSFLLASAGDDAPSTSYLVLDEDVEAGETVSSAAVSFEPMELSPELIVTSLTSTDGLDGATALRDLRRGDLLSVDDLIAAPVAGGETHVSIHEITFGVPLDRTPELVPGDRVTVLGTLSDITAVAVEDAPVLHVETDPERIGGGGHGILTLAIEDAGSVLRIAHITQTSELTIVRSTRAVDDVYPESIESTRSPVGDSTLGIADPADGSGDYTIRESTHTADPLTTPDRITPGLAGRLADPARTNPAATPRRTPDSPTTVPHLPPPVTGADPLPAPDRAGEGNRPGGSDSIDARVDTP